MTATYIAAYLSCAFLLLAWSAYLDKSTLREAFWLSLLWPASLAFLLVYAPFVLLERRGWNVALVPRPFFLSPIGFRRAPNGQTGWAVRFVWVELQVWKRGGAP